MISECCPWTLCAQHNRSRGNSRSTLKPNLEPKRILNIYTYHSSKSGSADFQSNKDHNNLENAVPSSRQGVQGRLEHSAKERPRHPKAR
jgi:hypothetical protein